MKRAIQSLLLVSCLVAMLALIVPASAQANSGLIVTCDTGTNITNGVEVVVNMRTGYTYRATAIGVNGFDPVLAVLNPNGTGLCNDDDSFAASYSASLPTIGFVGASSTSSQVFFSNNGSGFQDVSLVVGGYSNTHGQFVLILEGMAVTSADGSGDPFYVNLTPNLIYSGVPVTAYMISLDTNLDPLIKMVDRNENVVTDDFGGLVACDDAGNTSLCWGSSSALSNSYVSTENGQLPGYQYDAMLNVPLSDFAGVSAPYYLGFQMSSASQSTLGQYAVAFHMGV